MSRHAKEFALLETEEKSLFDGEVNIRETTTTTTTTHAKKLVAVACLVAALVGLLGVISTGSVTHQPPTRRALSSVSQQQQQQQQLSHRRTKVDPNTVVTDVDHLPAAKDTSTPAKKPATAIATDGGDSPSRSADGAILPSSEDIRPSPLQEEEPAGFRHSPAYFSDKYLRRAMDSRRTTFVKDWGSWTFQDPNPSNRPTPEELEDLAKKFPNRDIPRDKFPPNAWQTDPAYLKPWLKQGVALTERALKAMLAEYGHYDIKSGMSLQEAMADADATQNAYMFNLTVVEKGEDYGRAIRGNAGWATPAVFTRLKRLMLHAIMTQDKFFVTMGGHSSAAGHGNHFQQSYTLQIQRALEPIMARLGVYHQARNIGMGGLGTIHNALGAQSIYGGDNAILIWDSSMTEREKFAQEIFERQGYLGGDRVPILHGGRGNRYSKVGVQNGAWNSGFWGTGTSGVPKTESIEQELKIPFAARYIECKKEMFTRCRKREYNGICWVNRTDFQPKTLQQQMGGRAKWHPGNKKHQFLSRFYVYNIVKQLREALLDWQSTEGFALPDEAWHVSDSFKSIREAVLAKSTNNKTGVHCWDQGLPNIVCGVPFSARSEYTPRANPRQTSIRSILHPDVKIPGPQPNVYDPPDMFNKAFHPPAGAIDYVAIVESGNDFLPMLKRRRYLQNQIHPPKRATPRKVSKLPAGQGWFLDSGAAADNCDGTYDSFCKRDGESKCLLYGHNDHRGNLKGDPLSGWLIMMVPNVKHGTIILKNEILRKFDNHRTKKWTCENNAKTCDNPVPVREPKEQPKKCEDFGFEFAINGVITKWSRDEYYDNRVKLGRVVFMHVLLNDPTITGDVEVAVRVGGNCGRDVGLGISHIYWA